MESFLKISQKIGKSVVFAQGGGGNTSVKIGDQIFVKASGFFLKDLKKDYGYVCCQYNVIKNYLLKCTHFVDDRSLSEYNSEIIFDEFIKKNMISEKSFGEPSIETGLHAILLSKYIIHTHNVYANVFNCMKDGEGLLSEIFSAKDFLFFPYYNPGLALAKALVLYIGKQKKFPNIIFLKNHGLITHHDNSDEALRLTLEVNNKLQKYLKQKKVFQKFTVAKTAADFTKHLFPDSAVYSQMDISSLKGQRQQVFYEINSVVNYILSTIKKLNSQPNFINKKNIEVIRNMEKEKLRLNLLK